jgi:hypothetical protein
VGDLVDLVGVQIAAGSEAAEDRVAQAAEAVRGDLARLGIGVEAGHIRGHLVVLGAR